MRYRKFRRFPPRRRFRFSRRRGRRRSSGRYMIVGQRF